MNMLETIVPRSDQLNSDDLIGQSLTIKVTEVRFKAGDDQPVSIHFDGDQGKPYKPCKSMRRVLVQAWGADANQYLGRSMSIYRDPKVLWGGQAVGGIRITHLSDIEVPLTMALTATRGSRKAYTVNVLAATQAVKSTQPPTAGEYLACDGPGYKLLESRRKETCSAQSPQLRSELQAAKKVAFDRLAAQANGSAAAANTLMAEQSSDADNFNLAAALERIKQAGDIDILKQAWGIVCDHFDSLNEEVPVEFDAAYQFTKERIES